MPFSCQTSNAVNTSIIVIKCEPEVDEIEEKEDDNFVNTALIDSSGSDDDDCKVPQLDTFALDNNDSSLESNELKSHSLLSTRDETPDDMPLFEPIVQLFRIDGAKKNQCIYCGKVYDKNAYLVAHIRTHTGERPFKCDHCGKTYARKSVYRKHLLTHAGKPFRCHNCGKGYSFRQNLVMHMRVHTGERPYLCKECGKGFYSNRNLKRHFRQHTGEKPLVCELCGKAFRCDKNLKDHMAVHTDDRPHVCEHCAMRFKLKSNLYRHVRNIHPN